MIAKCVEVAWWTPATTESVSFVDFCAPARGTAATPTAMATATAAMAQARKEAFHLMCRSSLGCSAGGADGAAVWNSARRAGITSRAKRVMFLVASSCRHAAHLEDPLDDAAARLLEDLAHAVARRRDSHHRVHPVLHLAPGGEGGHELRRGPRA